MPFGKHEIDSMDCLDFVVGLAARTGVAAVPAYKGLVVRPDDELGDALVELAGAKEGRALVLDDGRLAGLLSVTDVSRLLEVRRLRLAR